MRLLAGASATALCGTALAQSFSGLGFLPSSTSSWARDISENGLAVVGDSPTQSWRWTSATGMVGLGTLPGYPDLPTVGGVSADGSVVVGDSLNSQTTNRLPFRWNAGVLEPLDGQFSAGFELGVSANGVFAVGGGPNGSSYTAFRSSVAGGRQSLGPLMGTPNGPAGHSTAFAASSDGSVIVGYADALLINPTRVIATDFRWTAATGMQAMLQSNGQLFNGTAQDVSADGTVIAGATFAGDAFFRWTPSGGYQLIAVPSQVGGQQFMVHISGDGSTIIGHSSIWTAPTGVRSITDVLTAAGCDFTGWTISGATGISYDGRTLCGEGIDPQGQREAWIATVPAPASTLALLGLVALSRGRR